jgi:hypothetical protein
MNQLSYALKIILKIYKNKSLDINYINNKYKYLIYY